MIIFSLYCNLLKDDTSKQLIEYIEKYFINNINDVYDNKLSEEIIIKLQKELSDSNKTFISYEIRKELEKLGIDKDMFKI